jgi:hypothetical protein
LNEGGWLWKVDLSFFHASKVLRTGLTGFSGLQDFADGDFGRVLKGERSMGRSSKVDVCNPGPMPDGRHLVDPDKSDLPFAGTAAS